LQRVHDLTLPDKMRSCEINKALNVETLLRIKNPSLDDLTT